MSYDFSPDYGVHPGKTLEELMSERKISVKYLCEVCVLGEDLIQEILDGTRSIDYSTAEDFEVFFNIPKSFWINRQEQYDKYLKEEKMRELVRSNGFFSLLDTNHERFKGCCILLRDLPYENEIMIDFPQDGGLWRIYDFSKYPADAVTYRFQK